MYHGKYVFSKLFEFLPKNEFEKYIARYKGNHKNKGFTCRNQFLVMSLGQLTNRLHNLLDLRSNLPTFIHISDGKMHDVNVLDELVVEASAIDSRCLRPH